MTLLVWHVVCPASINVSPVVVLVTVRVNFPYVLQQAHLLSARHGQNPWLEIAFGACCWLIELAFDACVCVKSGF